MILLLGGTSESGPAAQALLHTGHHVLVSTATDMPASLPDHERLRRRTGRLGTEEMIDLVSRRNVRLIVDVTHPYAAEATRTALSAAAAAAIPCLRLVREASIEPAPDVTFAPTHADAARAACRLGRPVLLTIGSRNLDPYVREADRSGIDLFARILPTDDAQQAACRADIPANHRIAARGPFSVEQNRAHLRRHHIGVLVTKDSGPPGGTPQKLRAAREEGCRIIALRRPPEASRNACTDVAQLSRRAEHLLTQEHT